MTGALFDPGKILMTPSAIEVIARAGQKPSEFLIRHVSLHQGELDNGDHAQNKSALNSGLRIFSAFKTRLDDRVWVITDAVDVEAGESPRIRDLTTILLPEDY